MPMYTCPTQPHTYLDILPCKVAKSMSLQVTISLLVLKVLFFLPAQGIMVSKFKLTRVKESSWQSLADVATKYHIFKRKPIKLIAIQSVVNLSEQTVIPVSTLLNGSWATWPLLTTQTRTSAKGRHPLVSGQLRMKQPRRSSCHLPQVSRVCVYINILLWMQ